jgi:PAS domain S-box-containing protein
VYASPVPPPEPPAKTGEPVRLEDALALLQATLDATADGILVVDENGRIVTYNRQFTTLWRIPSAVADAGDDEALVAFVLEQVENPAAFVQKIMELYSDPGKESHDTLAFKDGRRFERRSMPRRLAGVPVGRVWTFRDVTDLVRSEEELARAHALLRATFDATADGILVVDNDGDLVDFNRKAIEMWGIPSDVITSFDKKRLRDWVVDQLKDPERFLKKVKEIYSEPEGQSYDWVHFKDGRRFERYSKPLKVADRVVGRVWSFRDVTEQTRLEEELRLLRGSPPDSRQP